MDEIQRTQDTIHPLATESPKQIRSSSRHHQSPQSPRESDDGEDGQDGADGPNIQSDDPDGLQTGTIEIPAWKKFIFSKWGCAVLISTLTIFLLLLIRPAFFLKRRENTLDRPKINWVYVFVTWIILFFAIVTVPFIIGVCRKKWVGKA